MFVIDLQERSISSIETSYSISSVDYLKLKLELNFFGPREPPTGTETTATFVVCFSFFTLNW